MTPTKDQIREYYAAALERSLEAYSRLDEKALNKKASDDWIAKEHIASLVGTMEKETLPLTRQALAGEAPNIPGFASRSDLRGFRQSTMEEVRDLPVTELLQRMRAAFEEHIALLDTLSDSDLDKPASSPGWDRPGTVRDLFFASYLFLPGQYQEIRHVAKKQMPHWIEGSTPDQVNYHMGRIFHYMPLIFNSEKGADFKANYQFTMEGDGGGQWALEISDGKAVALTGVLDSHDIEIKTKPQLWIDLTTGDLNAPMAIATRKVKLGGNMGLALKLGELFSAEG
ncbi:MAG: SCP2 sterol-binding domain-containing protein [Chloroflexi bacterium]|nr:SCP2 sterol-binding domain-containing protein [Chloroflexota bacterium]